MSTRSVRKLVYLSTHPIQYLSPWFEDLSSQPGLDLEVWYGHAATPADQAAEGYGVEFEWDVPLLEGYRYRFLENVARQPSLHSFTGIDVPGINDLLRSQKPDALVVNGWHFLGSWQAMYSCWRQGIPVMVRSDSHLQTTRSHLKRAMKWPFYRSFIPRMDACLAAGTWAADYFRHYGAADRKVFRVPHSVSSDWLRPPGESATTRRSLRDQLGLSDSEFVVLYVGSLISRKRPLDLVEALSGKECPNICLLVVGAGPLRDEFERKARDSGVRAHFAGFVNQASLPGFYLAADLLVLPSESETWGMVVNEAMASGLPAIVSDRVGCGPDLIRTGENGFIYPVADCGALSRHVLLCARDRNGQEFTAMRENAFQTIREDNLSAATEGLMEALECVLH